MEVIYPIGTNWDPATPRPRELVVELVLVVPRTSFSHSKILTNLHNFNKFVQKRIQYSDFFCVFAFLILKIRFAF